ncbi:MAG: transcriptional repressor [Candidatus Aminicenantes bacterium]|nr:transcriptional repressor [Candidatus Aminicenantes bacterium]MDH5744260.1 transcriptional repressor [Candidatus Aminicenantes bacterium]
MELKEFKDYLKSQDLKFTRTRRLIFEEIFSENTVHSNAYEIHRRLKGKGEKISLATIYRTLNLLVKSGLVSEIDFGENHSHYEPEVSKATHGHLVCLSCGAVKEFSDEKIQSILKKIGKESRFKTDKFSIQVFGYCQDCKTK